MITPVPVEERKLASATPTAQRLAFPLVIALALAGCSSGSARDPGAPHNHGAPAGDARRASAVTASPVAAPAASGQTPSPASGASRRASRPSPDLPAKDFTADAASQYVPHPSAELIDDDSPSLRATPAVDHADPLRVARAFIATRLTYRYDDPAGYAAAVTAPAYTTRAFAARSQPTAAALSRQRTSQEVSTVRVGAAEVEGEAPNTARTRYVSVELTASVSYRGDGSSRPQDEVWTLRLVQTPAQQWRVDAVLSTR